MPSKFASDPVSIQQARNIAEFLWPEFVEIDGAVFLARYAEQGRQHIKNDVTEPQTVSWWESSENHTHILDFFEHNASLDDGNDTGIFWDHEHPDFKVACEIGKIMVFTWAYKLMHDFPNYRFRVYYTQEDNPIVRFLRVRSEADYFLDPDDWSVQISSGQIIIVDTADLCPAI
jgi:hypothetical protein